MYLRCCMLVLVALSFLSQEEPQAEERDWANELARGYANANQEPLMEFLKDWQSKTKPVPPETLKKKPEFERAIYELFPVFYQARDEEDDYKKARYALIQNTVNVHIVDSDLAGANEAGAFNVDSLIGKLPYVSSMVCEDFRPAITLKGRTVLYIEDDPLSIMLIFLLSEKNAPYGAPDLLTQYRHEDCTTASRKKKLKFLNSALDIAPGHFDQGWIFVRGPHADVIYLSSDCKRAVVFYNVSVTFGYALLERQKDGVWKIKWMDDVGCA